MDRWILILNPIQAGGGGKKVFALLFSNSSQYADETL